MNRENQFRKVYDNKKFKHVLQYKNSNFPLLVDIEITNHCNLKCLFCSRLIMKRSKGFMTEILFKKIVDECSQYNTPIRFTLWGEPFLHPKIIDFCRYVKSKILLLHITSNGLLIKESDMKSLINLGVDSIVFSFQGATKEQYEIMRNNNKYDRLKMNVLKMVELRKDKLKPFIHISSTMINETEEELKKFIKYWENIVDSVGNGRTNLSRLSAYYKGKEDFDFLREIETIKKGYRTCVEVWQKLNINWDGKISCCCADYDNLMMVGDMNKDTLYNIWNNSEELKLFRKLLDKKMFKSLSLCSNCYHTYEGF